MRSLSLKTAWLVAITGLSLWACGGGERNFVNPGAGGTAGQGQGGDAGTTSAGTSGEAGAADGGMGGEAGTASGGSNSGGSSGNGGTAGASGGSAGNAGTGGIIVPPDPGRPGFGLVATGNWMKSTNYKLFGAIGESPGMNLVSESENFRLAGSVIGTTQP